MLDENRGKLSIEKWGRRLSFISASSWSKVGVLSAVASAGLILYDQLIAAAFVYLFAGFCDLVDGMVSRRHKVNLERDAFIDTIADRYTDFIVLFALFVVDFPQALVPFRTWILLYLFGSMMASYVKSAAKEKELSSRELRFGFIQRAERIFIICIGMVVSYINPVYLTYVIAVLAVEINVEALHRYRKILASDFTMTAKK